MSTHCFDASVYNSSMLQGLDETLRSSLLTDSTQLLDTRDSQGVRLSDRSSAAPVDDSLNGISTASSSNTIVSSNTLITNSVGRVSNQADIATRANVARNLYGVDGTGITIGVLSDSFNRLGGASADTLSGDLPTNRTILQDSTDGKDEGRAMMQLIHDIAPGARLLFHTANGGEANFAQGIRALANAGADIIVDDVIYLSEPMFQDGIIAQAVNEVVSKGVAYFSSAGNSGRTSYESGFNPSGFTFNGATAHDFNPGIGVDPYQSVSIAAGSIVKFSLQWDSPFASLNPFSGGSRSDLDIYLLDSFGNVVASETKNNLGGDPVEVLSFKNINTYDINLNLVITNAGGVNPGLIKYVASGGDITINEYDTRSSTLYGHANARGAVAVGAAPFYRTPTYTSGTTPVLEDFSSAGGTRILFDMAGNRLLTPEIRLKPTIVAPDAVNTTFFGEDILQDSDTLPNFSGTSAAAPNAAAVAALMLQANPYVRPADIYQALEVSALDMDDPSTFGFDRGFDFASGYGLIQADAAISALTAGNTLAAARNLGVLSGTRITSDFVGNSDAIDYYRVQINRTSNFSAVLSGLSADADLALIRDFSGNGVIDPSDVLGRSAAFGTTSERINGTNLLPGTYFVAVSQYIGNTAYDLQLTVA